jgi:hypothetical protein
MLIEAIRYGDQPEVRARLSQRIEHNFDHEPIVTHGPYDFDTTVPPGWASKDYPIPPENLKRPKH